MLDLCSKCGSILKVREGKYSSELGTNKVFFTQEIMCDNKQCENNQIVIDTVKHEMN